MQNSSKILHDKLLEQFIDFAWCQWTSLGAPGNRATAGDWLIDPEALFLIILEKSDPNDSEQLRAIQ